MLARVPAVIALAVASASALSLTCSAPVAAPHKQATVSSFATNQTNNWSGYASIRSGVRTVSATVTVPVLKGRSGRASSWVGIDGLTNGYLAQTGIETDVVAGRAVYYAWWEVITPSHMAPQATFTGFALKPGDQISIKVTISPRTKLAYLYLHNVRTGRTATKAVRYGGPGTSAEWIQEATSEGDGTTMYVCTTPNWGNSRFARLRVNNAVPKLGAAQRYEITDGVGVHETRTSTASKGGFSVRWLAAGHRTQLW